MLLLLPLYVAMNLRLSLLNKLLKAVARMVVGLVVMSGCVYLVMRANNVLVSLLAVFAMIALGSCVALSQSRQKASTVLFPIFASSVITVFVFGLWFVFLVLGVKNPFETRWLLPVCALLCGAVSWSVGKAIAAYYAGLINHRQLYDYLLGNGAMHAEATRQFLRRAMNQAMIPLVRRMGELVVPFSATAFWVLLMCGVDAFQAAIFEALLMVAMLATAVSTLFLTIFLGRHYAFDKYNQLIKKPTQPAHPVAESQPQTVTTVVTESSEETEQGEEDA